MNLFCSITSRKSITTVIILILNVSYSYQSCVSLFDSCEYDCDCCGNDINKGIRCELRNQHLGKRCYESQSVGQSCNISSQCNSQNCVNNICQPLLRSPAANPIPFCPLVGDSSYITAPVNGLLPICACPKGPTQVQDASYAMDDNLSTDYVNYNSHTYSGFIVETTSNAPLRKIVLCTSNANPENDPMCFRLEGKCEHDDNFTLLQEGMIPFVGDLRQSCTTIAVERGRQSYSQYKILFGCRRGGYDDSCQRDSRFHKFRRQIRNRNLDAVCTGDYPVILSEVRLLGKCNEGSLFTPPTAPTTPTEAPTKSLPTSPPTEPPTSPLTRPPTSLPTSSPTRLLTQAPTSSSTSPPLKEPCTATLLNYGHKLQVNVDRLRVDENTYVFAANMYYQFSGMSLYWHIMVAIDKSRTFIQSREKWDGNKELTVATWNSANVAPESSYSISDVTFCAKE